MLNDSTNLRNSNQTVLSEEAPFRADHVGSLLRPDKIKNARLQRAAGEITLERLREVENEEIVRIVNKQKEIGLQAVTDGEFRRAWWHFDFLENLIGVEGHDTDSGIQFHQTQTKSHAIKVTGKLDFGQHPMLEDYRFLQSIAEMHTTKMTIPSPSMLHFRGEIEKDAYSDDEEFFHDLALTYKKAIQSFYDAGCRYLQLDDTSWAYLCSEEQKEHIRARGLDPDYLAGMYLKTINDAVSARPADMKITMHICRGNFRSTWISSGGYEPVAELLFDRLNIDGFFLEYDTDRAGGFEPLRFVKRPDLKIVLGLITSKFGELENAEEVKRRIEEASRFVDLHQLCLSPQCGFASTEEGNLLTEEQQWAKLRHVVEIAQDVWK
ncbi:MULTISPECIES: 5-methyltetrahydropteroyltriglutamate--homocysteine S-methyltransferase [Bacillus]|uniref:5-methyltetrahydropteroyltriglutamate-- homocysteine S-methyltransferase n=1 Tax=Bacillus TaxID=1386 RepID=UPI000C772632|nr:MULTISPECIES: 5-methyltetrahydropteroyltriglutamate--homocysteine S-methyltransferase [Bacillus]PLR85806.1 5-methyltetrahydropteroyltriglutamate--homocysteine methyltransferase [Bacillus sp. V33-4]RSK44031.1 5-methyltetrahydropteroyltriglutamate--homocysteine S-methyltransferase [Bacillus canaveralius]